MAGNQEIVIDGGGPHPYHLVKPSIWPLLGALSGGLLTGGLVIDFHYAADNPLARLPMVFGILAVLFVMWGWWSQVVKESVKEKEHTGVVKIGLRYGMALFITSEVFFFLAFFWAFFDASLFPKEGIGGVWPPEGIAPLPAFELPLMMTLILLLSGCTVTIAHHALQVGRTKDAANYLLATVLLGAAFSGFQVYEYSHAPFGFTQTVYASTFYMATGFHGLHVLIGTIFLFVCWRRTVNGHFTPKSHFGFEAAAWYWHFVDVVWLFLFFAVYWWGAGDAVPHAG
jgi:cytochrome c oxidase subunit 3